MTTNKTELKIFSSFYVDKLFRNVASTKNHDNYLLDKFPFEENYSKGPTGIFINPNLKLNPDQKKDIDNSISIYEELKNLTEIEASDERLWVSLSHNLFWDYMRERWPAEQAKNPIGRIRERYFLRNLKLESITRNGLSRLWWYAHITHDISKGDRKYELLETMLQRQDLAVGITERAIGTSQPIRTGLLEFLKVNTDIAKSEDKTRELIKNLNLFGGVKFLPLFNTEEIINLLIRITPNSLPVN